MFWRSTKQTKNIQKNIIFLELFLAFSITFMIILMIFSKTNPKDFYIRARFKYRDDTD